MKWVFSLLMMLFWWWCMQLEMSFFWDGVLLIIIIVNIISPKSITQQLITAPHSTTNDRFVFGKRERPPNTEGYIKYTFIIITILPSSSYYYYFYYYNGYHHHHHFIRFIRMRWRGWKKEEKRKDNLFACLCEKWIMHLPHNSSYFDFRLTTVKNALKGNISYYCSCGSNNKNGFNVIIIILTSTTSRKVVKENKTPPKMKLYVQTRRWEYND